MLFKYDEVISFAKEYIKSKNIPLDKVLEKGIRIENPSKESELFVNVRSISLPGEAFFVDGDVLCSDIEVFQWSKGVYDIRVFVPDEYYFPDCKEFLYPYARVNGYSSKDDWNFFNCSLNCSLEEDTLFLKIYMDRDSLVCTNYKFLDFTTKVLTSEDQETLWVSELMSLTNKSIKDVYILNTCISPRYYVCDGDEIRLVLGSSMEV